MPPRQVDKARRETGKGRLPRLARVAVDHLLHRNAEQLGHGGQVFAVVLHRNFDQAAGRGIGHAHLGIGHRGACTQRRHQVRQRHGRALVSHQQGAGRRHHLQHTRDGLVGQHTVQRHGAGQIGQLYQQSVVTGGQETHGHYRSIHKRAQRHTGLL